jgi:hypothetical protein
MKFDCYLSEHCGSYHSLRENLYRALKHLGLTAEIDFHTIYYDEAVALDIKGSPTIRLDGSDLFPIEGSPSIT